MPTPRELVKANTGLDDRQVERLERLLRSWQLISDLSFADLLLWCRLSDKEGYICVAQIRPHTAQTLHPDDEFGRMVPPGEMPALDSAFSSQVPAGYREAPPTYGGEAMVEAIPIPDGERIVAVISKESAPLVDRRPGRLEQNYLECAAALWRMIEEGSFPFAGEDLDPELAPRVGDGMIRLDASGKVLYASPNAISAYRRLGISSNIEGEKLSEVGLDVTPASLALTLGVPAEGDVEVGHRVVLQRAIPFIEGRENRVTGGVLLLRDVTELRYRERQLESKETVISEVHHRVKNNLQTIASLLRIQARRLPAEPRQELEEAVRRIASIALVHETLSREPGQSVAFREVAGRLVEMVKQGLVHPERRIEIEVEGDAGNLPPEVATPLAIVLVELLQNCVEHAFGRGDGRAPYERGPGTASASSEASGEVGRAQSRGAGDQGTRRSGGADAVTVSLSRDEHVLRLTVADNGGGLPEDFGQRQTGLGLQIVGTLVESELGGQMSLRSNGGTTVDIEVPLRPRTSLGL